MTLPIVAKPTNPRFVDIEGQKFHRLTVLGYVGYHAGSHKWKCRCDCGGVKDIARKSLERGLTQSCGCRRRETFADLSGQTFGRLTVISGPERSGDHGYELYWECQCSCGRTASILSERLTSGKTKSCGCLNTDFDFEKKHGVKVAKHPLLSTYYNMLDRCNNKKSDGYENYGGRGIKICTLWQNSFDVFIDDMGPRPEGFTLERVDNNKNYEPSNVVWASMETQQQNKRNTVLNPDLVREILRLKKLGYSVPQILDKMPPNVTRSAVGAVFRGKTWRNVS